jgi:hypothetical protein
MPATNNSAPSYIHTGHTHQYERTTPVFEGAAVAGAPIHVLLRRGNFVILPPNSRLYGESL